MTTRRLWLEPHGDAAAATERVRVRAPVGTSLRQPVGSAPEMALRAQCIHLQRSAGNAAVQRMLGAGLDVPAALTVQRAGFERDEGFPAIKDPTTGEQVFDGGTYLPVQSFVHSEAENGSIHLYVGQDYLNTTLSKQYRANSDAILNKKSTVLIDSEETASEREGKIPRARIVEGHHRILWKLFHEKAASFDVAGEVGKSELSNIGDMTYKELDAVEPVEAKGNAE